MSEKISPFFPDLVHLNLEFQKHSQIKIFLAEKFNKLYHTFV